MPYSYTCHRNEATGLWQILSRSGHVLYESRDGAYVRQVCAELCQHLREPPTQGHRAAYQLS